MVRFEGRCPRCSRTFHSDRENDIVFCGCWKTCPTCGETMTPYTPDLAQNTYGSDGQRDLQVLMVCTRHSPIFLSTQKPVEVVCT
jgi:hypothetical protein